MNVKKMIAANKLCVCFTMTAICAAAGMIAAKSLVKHCCYSERMKCKAKRAFRTMEESLLD